MSAFVSKINKYLLHHYPNIWNVRLVWMLGASLILHALFFLLGYVILSNPGIFKGYLSDGTLFADFGIGFLITIISILMIVLWLIHLFKNNAFKNFYPYSGWKLFLSFFYMVIILFACTTFHLSFMLGFKTYISQHYPESLIKEQQEKSNLASIFLNASPSDYNLENKKFPPPYDSIYMETDMEKFRLNEKIYDFGVYKYQFFSVKMGKYYSPEWEKRDSVAQQSLNFEYGVNDTLVYWMKSKVLTLDHTPDTSHTYFNYANIPFDVAQRETYYDNDRKFLTYGFGNNLIKSYCEKWHSLLQQKDKAGVEKILTDFLAVCNYYKVNNNLELKRWVNIIFKNENFIVDSFISMEGYDKSEFVNSNTVEAPAPLEGALDNSEAWKKYYEQHLTNMFVDVSALQNVYSSIENLRSFDYLDDAFKVQLSLALALSLLIFMFRITDGRTLIFAAVAAGLIAVLMMFVAFTNRQIFGYDTYNLSLYYSMFVILTLILFVPFLLSSGLSKMVRGVHINLVLAGFVFWLWFLLLIIDGYLEMSHDAKYSLIDGSGYQSIFNEYGELLFYGVWFLCFMLPAVLAVYIKKWKGSPEQ